MASMTAKGKQPSSPLPPQAAGLSWRPRTPSQPREPPPAAPRLRVSPSAGAYAEAVRGMGRGRDLVRREEGEPEMAPHLFSAMMSGRLSPDEALQRDQRQRAGREALNARIRSLAGFGPPTPEPESEPVEPEPAESGLGRRLADLRQQLASGAITAAEHSRRFGQAIGEEPAPQPPRDSQGRFAPLAAAEQVREAAQSSDPPDAV